MRLSHIAISLLFTLVTVGGYSQCDSIADWCDHNVGASFISDGQLYRALLYNDQVAEFQVTLFGGTTYRIAGCSGAEDGNLIFRLYDPEKNLLFSNQDHSNAPYWDFVVDSTVDCTVEAQLDVNRQESGCAVLLIGFKQ